MSSGEMADMDFVARGIATRQQNEIERYFCVPSCGCGLEAGASPNSLSKQFILLCLDDAVLSRNLIHKHHVVVLASSLAVASSGIRNRGFTRHGFGNRLERMPKAFK